MKFGAEPENWFNFACKGFNNCLLYLKNCNKLGIFGVFKP